MPKKGQRANERPVKKSKAVSRKISRTRKPDDMSVEDWQIALRREFGRNQSFILKNTGDAGFFSDYAVTNTVSGGTYRVAIRGLALGENYCSCPDFAVNTLGTCKHIEFVLGKLEHKRGAKQAFQEGFRPAHSAVYLRYGAQREVRFRPGMDCPKDLLAHVRRYFDANDALRPGAYAEFQQFLTDAPVEGHDLRCYEDAIQFVAQVRDDAQRRQRIDELFPKGVASAAFQKLVKTELYPYQKEGALFAATAGRCLLADDMGLGKTIQAITAVEILARTVGIERVLILAPTSLKHQWKHEIERFTGRTAVVVEGALSQRAAAYASESFFKITNYDVLYLDHRRIAEWAPDVVILDEAQRIKNWKTRTAQCVKRIESDYAIVLTGTPLENRLEELHSIVEFVDRFRLGPLFRFLHEHQHVDEAGRVIGYRNLSEISKTLAPILLRRTKSEVLKQLPERTDKHFFVPMTEEQQQHHQENEDAVAKIVYKWRKNGFLTEADQRRLMVCLQYMRMACNSTYLIDKVTDQGVKADELLALLDDLFQEDDTKAVVFSQWVGTHELIARRLAGRPWGHVFYHGGVPSKDRNALVQRFKQDPACRLFLATDAGGVGLNLQHASVVINMDQPWNPAVLEQRIGRVHRLGQRRNVRVFHFVSQGTIEHSMLNVLSFKKSVFAGVLDGGESEVFLGGTKLKKFMDTVEEVSGKIPEGMPRQEPASEAEPREEDTAAASDTVSVATPAEPWNELISQGMALVGELAQAFQPPTQSGKESARAAAGFSPASFIAKDERSGESYLRLPVPDSDTIKGVADFLGALAKALNKG